MQVLATIFQHIYGELQARQCDSFLRVCPRTHSSSRLHFDFSMKTLAKNVQACIQKRSKGAKLAKRNAFAVLHLVFCCVFGTPASHEGGCRGSQWSQMGEGTAWAPVYRGQQARIARMDGVSSSRRLLFPWIPRGPAPQQGKIYHPCLRAYSPKCPCRRRLEVTARTCLHKGCSSQACCV